MKIQYKLLASASIALFTIIRTDRNMLLACYSHKHISYRIRTIIRKAITYTLIMSNIILPRNFYERSTLIVAGELLGKVLKFSNFSGIITEVEAYIGMNDPACHAARGYTNRTSVMFGVPGFSYVYFIYGMYYCLNIVTEAEGFPAAVLIRGLKLIEPLEANLGGPGILCKRLNITKEHNKQDLTISHEFCVYESHLKPDYICTPRIGISKGQEKFWRFKIF